MYFKKNGVDFCKLKLVISGKGKKQLIFLGKNNIIDILKQETIIARAYRTIFLLIIKCHENKPSCLFGMF